MHRAHIYVHGAFVCVHLFYILFQTVKTKLPETLLKQPVNQGKQP